MDIRLCAVIPIYNHPETIAATIAQLQALSIPCVVIDDASNAQTQNVLETLHPQDLYLQRLPENLGKGGAVMAGLTQAQTLAFTHALQIDADGQHNAADIPRLIEQANAHPDAIICGQPIYDESIPTGRKIARYITHFWVGVETLTLHPFDTMCGFRIYPLAPVNDIIQNDRLGRRMDFDIEILVRSIWQRIPIISVDTKVIYPEQGTSHFHYLKDNWLISVMHTKLCFGMLWRFPRLVFQSTGRPHQQHWSAVGERGSLLGIRLLLWLYRALGRHVIKLCLYPVIAYFYFANRRARSASKLYLKRLQEKYPNQFKRTPNGWTSYRHMLTFADAALDKVASWLGDIQADRINFDRASTLIDLAAKGQGIVIVSAHLGNIEVSRAISERLEAVTMNALMFTEHAGKFNQVLKEINPDVEKSVILVNQIGPETAIEFKQKIDQGEMLVVLGDRTPVNSTDRISYVDFLGQPAAFPQGPFILASLMQCPVYLMFCMQEGKQYRIYLEHFDETIKLARKTRQADLEAVVQRYVTRLEHYCQQYPLQWYNFFDIWDVKSASTRQ